jgi:hypothetical protein
MELPERSPAALFGGRIGRHKTMNAPDWQSSIGVI